MVLTVSISVQANGIEKEDPVTSTSEKEENTTVNYKEVKDVFMKVKRIDNILSPKKKLRKKKYTIA